MVRRALRLPEPKRGSENMYDLGPELTSQEVPESEQRLQRKAGALAGLEMNPHVRDVHCSGR